MAVGATIAADGEHAFGIGIAAQGPLPCHSRPASAVLSFVIDDAAAARVEHHVSGIIEVGLPRTAAREHARIIAMHPEIDVAKLELAEVPDPDLP